MFLFYIIAGLLAFSYAFILILLLHHWEKTDTLSPNHSFVPSTPVSVLIPARNEALNIEKCLQALLKQDYPKQLLEIIVIDDFSDDLTAEIVKSYTKHFKYIFLLSLSDYLSPEERENSFKKKALDLAISQAKGDLIITTDADCWAGNLWLKTIVSAYQSTKSVFIAAPVLFEGKENYLENFQALDFIGMMGVTGGGIKSGWVYMCNGANMAFAKKAFEAVGGYTGNQQFASGDDVFLLNKIVAKYPEGLHFLKSNDAVVYTKPMETLSDFYQQRLRWATKNSAYKSWRMLAIQGVVFATCCFILICLPLAFFSLKWLGIGCFVFLIKGVGDYIYLKHLSRFFRRAMPMKSFLSNQFLHVFYIAFIGMAGLFKKEYTWKGRKVR